MRAFLALPLPEETRAALEALADLVPVGRVVPAENLHLTLVFLGEVDMSQLEALDDEMQGVRAGPVALELGDWEALGGRHPKVVALSARGPEALQKAVEARVRAAGLAPERRRFRPHVTLARLPRRMQPEQEARLARFLGRAAAPDVAPMAVDRIDLYQSHLGADGARYELLAEYPLR